MKVTGHEAIREFESERDLLANRKPWQLTLKHMAKAGGTFFEERDPGECSGGLGGSGVGDPAV